MDVPQLELYDVAGCADIIMEYVKSVSFDHKPEVAK
jgi:hypothetical protein